MTSTTEELLRELKGATLSALKCKTSMEWWSGVLAVVDCKDRVLAAQLETATASPPLSSEARLAAFTKWLHANKRFSAHKAVEFKPHPLAGNGVFATGSRGIAQADVVFSIPLEMCIGYDCKALTKEMLGNRVVQSNASIALALCLLLEEQQRDKRFAEYIAILPTEFETMPITWSKAELALLQDLNVSVVIGHSILNICLAYCHFIEANFLPASCTLKKFFWAMCVVFSRQNALRDGRLVLIPAFDMCNHDASLSEITTQEEEGGCIVSRAARAFAAGEEVTIFYGPRPNDEFLSHAGFVVRGNKHSKIVLPFTLESGAQTLPVQHVLLAGVPNCHKCGDASYLLTLGWNDVQALIAFARANCSTSKEAAAFALKRKLAGGNAMEMTAEEHACVQRLIGEQIAAMQRQRALAAASPNRASVVRVVCELRDSITDLLQNCLKECGI